MKKMLGLGIMLLALSACGSNKSSAAGGTDGGAKGDSSTAALKDSGSNSTATGDAAMKDSGSAMQQLMCDTTMMNVDKCGTDTCTPPDSTAAMICQVSCCTTDGKCGQKNTSAAGASMGAGTCTLPPTPDPSCPSQMLSFGGMSFNLVGCCTDTGDCGVSFGGATACRAGGFGGGTPKKCGATAPDAGTAGDAG